MSGVVDFVPVVIAFLLWVWMWWHVTTKIGYRGWLRKVWLVCLCIPPVGPVAMFLILVLPWPICKQLRQKEQELKSLTRRELR